MTKDELTDTKLENCPFCGAPAELYSTPIHIVLCAACEAEGPEAGDEERAIAAWNKRAITPKQKAAEETGAALIAAERQRQIESEGWTPEHDDAHGAGEMADAARAYIISGLRAERDTPQVHLPPPPPWPWDKCWWRPSTDPIRNLVKAGALIAAEIDRLQRAAKAGQTKPVDLK